MTSTTPRTKPPTSLLDKLTPLQASRLEAVWPHYIAEPPLTFTEISHETGLAIHTIHNLRTAVDQKGCPMPPRVRLAGRNRTPMAHNPVPAWGCKPVIPSPARKASVNPFTDPGGRAMRPPELTARTAPDPVVQVDEVRLLADQRDSVVLVFGDLTAVVACKGRTHMEVIDKLREAGIDQLPESDDDFAVSPTCTTCLVWPPPPELIAIPADPEDLKPLEEGKVYRCVSPWQRYVLKAKLLTYRVPVAGPDGKRWVEDGPEVEVVW